MFENYFGKPAQHIIWKNSKTCSLASLVLISANTREGISILRVKAIERY